MLNTILVGLGGGLGALARYSTGVYIQDKIESKIPLHTLFINVLGSFLLAYIYSHFKSRGLLVFLGTGFWFYHFFNLYSRKSKPGIGGACIHKFFIYRT